jgi:hypothetical protein
VEHLYVCHFSNGHVKVGRSIDPISRVAVHADRVACVGVSLVAHQSFECAENVIKAEYSLIQRCAAEAQKRNKNEWFEGLDFLAVCSWADEESTRLYEPEPQQPTKTFQFALLDRKRRYVCTWPNGGGIGQHVWADANPALPHWPDSELMRWDLRRDWHLIWPELVDHPCAIFFAKTHPLRNGSPRFADWVKSWPASFDSQELLRSMPESARLIVRQIWPELDTAKA